MQKIIFLDEKNRKMFQCGGVGIFVRQGFMGFSLSDQLKMSRL